MHRLLLENPSTWMLFFRLCGAGLNASFHQVCVNPRVSLMSSTPHTVPHTFFARHVDHMYVCTTLTIQEALRSLLNSL